MKKPEIPSNEAERLDTLRRYQLLDSEAEKEYDYITELASQICGTPIALVSIVDSERQWFKSKVGIDATETARDLSFCGHAIHSNELFEIEDSTQDERFRDNPLVTGAPNVIFYAGQPIVTSEGHKIGTLCVIDQMPRKLDDSQKRSLFILAQHIRQLLDLRLSNMKLSQAVLDIERKSLEMVQNAKLISQGRLASGIAHEINNPLAIIDGRFQQLLIEMEKVEAGSKTEMLVTSIQKAIIRIRDIIKGMLEFSRDDNSYEVENVLLSDCLNMIQPFFEEKCAAMNIQLIQKINSEVKINANRVQISQIIVNLLNNAIDAIKGEVHPQITIEVEADPDWGYLKVSDNGHGIPEDIIDDILEPFFTTKEVGQGTGLGLSISYGLSEKNKGRLSINKNFKDGAQFILQLPLVK